LEGQTRDKNFVKSILQNIKSYDSCELCFGFASFAEVAGDAVFFFASVPTNLQWSVKLMNG